MSDTIVFFQLSSAFAAIYKSSVKQYARIVPVSESLELMQALQANEVEVGFLAPEGAENSIGLRSLLASTLNVDQSKVKIVYFESQWSSEPAQFYSHLSSSIRKTNPQVRSLLLISDNSWHRKAAIEAGWKASPSSRLFGPVRKGESLRYVALRYTGDGAANLDHLQNLPVQISGALPESGDLVLIAPKGTIVDLVKPGFQIRFLGEPGLPLITELYVLRDDRFLSGGKSNADRFSADNGTDKWLLEVNNGWMVAAVPGGRSVDEVHFKETLHGHTILINSSRSLAANQIRSDEIVTKWEDLMESINNSLEGEPLDSCSTALINQITPASLTTLVDRLSGASPYDPSGPDLIESRYYKNKDDGNAHAVSLALAEMQAALGSSSAAVLESFLSLNYNMNNVVGEIPGNTTDIILLGAHIDSTAAWGDPTSDPAPGADDNATGVAAVLAIAHALGECATKMKPERTIRFVLFNQEEVGMHGSIVHSQNATTNGDHILALLNLDMLGHDHAGNPDFEIHCGSTRPTVLSTILDISLYIGELVKEFVPRVVAPAGLVPQLFPTSSAPNDPGNYSSDHYPFQERSYPACWITEDFYTGPPPAGSHDRNPNFHSDRDTAIDATYAAKIAKVIGCVVWFLANV